LVLGALEESKTKLSLDFGYIGDTAMALYALAQKRGDEEQARVLLGIGIEHGRGDRKARQDLARMYIQAKEYSKALVLLEKIIAGGGSTIDLLLDRANCHIRLGKPDFGIRDCNTVLGISASSPRAQMLKGLAMAEGENRAEMDACFDAALLAAPTSLKAAILINHAQLLLLYFDDHRGAGQKLDAARIASPSEQNLFYISARQALHRGDVEAAMKDLSREIAAYPDAVDSLKTRGMLHLYSDRPEVALKDLTAAIKPKSDANAYRVLAQVLLQKSGSPTSLIDHKISSPWYCALAAFAQGDLKFEDALKKIPEAPPREQNGHRCELAYFAGLLAKKSGDLTTARSYFEKAVNTRSFKDLDFALARIELQRLESMQK
jgi:tetratricopeptide (TPR) repeat protein